MAQFRQVKNRYPKSKFGRETDYRVADSYFNQKQWSAAADAYKLALEYDEWAEDAFYGLVLSQLRLKQISAAQDSLNMYMQRFPNGVLITELREKIQQLKNDGAAPAQSVVTGSLVHG